ncbi:hypothetical protein PILCRDRAFT_497682 [Piloderma croceum F 1598]|uniref:Uncharacterized protein n=1 Tax=Piloderma croceum (strain F 1598) TaxID=765440 RepID=A0A0C3BWA2_PILCF|nr:hypothetical protein PILCRDRAFT_497682 [Piloderma croceum F 1598]
MSPKNPVFHEPGRQGAFGCVSIDKTSGHDMQEGTGGIRGQSVRIIIYHNLERDNKEDEDGEADRSRRPRRGSSPHPSILNRYSDG